MKHLRSTLFLGATLWIFCYGTEIGTVEMVHNIRRELPSATFYILTAPQTFTIGSTTHASIIVSRRVGGTIIAATLMEKGTRNIVSTSRILARWYQKGRPISIPITIPKSTSPGFATLKVRLRGNFRNDEDLTVQIKRPELKILLRTDKYEYFPNEKVRGWVFVFNGGLLPCTNKIDSIISESFDGAVIFSQKNVNLSAGSASIEFSVPPDARLGRYLIRAKLEGNEAKIYYAVTPKFLDWRSNLMEEEYISKDFTRQRVKKELSKMQDDLANTNNMKYDDTYSMTRSFVSIVKPKRRLKVHQRERIVVTYNNPKEGVNHFYYQVKCKGDIVLSESLKDLYSSYVCLHGLKVPDGLDVIGGPSRRYLCKKKSTKFSIHIRATPKMVPFCSLLVYRVVKKTEIVADSTDLDTDEKFLKKLSLEVNKFDVTVGEEMLLSLIGNPISKVYIYGEKWVPGVHNEDEDIMDKKEILRFLKNSEHNGEVATLVHQCKSRNIKTTKQIFQDVGLMVRSSLETDPVVFCTEYNQKPNGNDNMIHKIHKQKLNPDYVKSYKKPWIWKEFSLRTPLFQEKINAPSNPGIWYLQAISTSEKEGLGMSEVILVQVNPKVIERSDFAAAKKLDGVSQRHRVTVTVKEHNLIGAVEEGRCRSLYLEICEKTSGSNMLTNGYKLALINIQNVPGFEFSEQEIEKSLMYQKDATFGYQLTKSSLTIQCKGCLRSCMNLSLKQTSSLQKDKRTGQVSVGIATGPTQSFLYSITDEICHGTNSP